MKFFHLSDLHFGKQLNGYDLAEEQRECMDSIMQHMEKEKPDAVLICGDIYDKSVPSGAAMELFEEVLMQIEMAAERIGKTIEVLVIAGNHDSAPRLQYASSFMERHHIHIAVMPPQEADEQIRKVTLKDDYGEVDFYLLPYTKPGMLRGLTEEPLETTQDAISFLLSRESFAEGRRKVLLSHQMYLHQGKMPKQCESELASIVVGGLDAVDVTVVEGFDYVALGHIHSPQNVGSPHIRYCGTPYKYSVSEANQEKTVTVVTMDAVGEVEVKLLPVVCSRDVRSIRGTLEELLMQGEEEKSSDYLSITLTDEDYLDHPKEKLLKYYDHILEVGIDNQRTRQIFREEEMDIRVCSPKEAFADFFEEVMGRAMHTAEEEAIQTIWEEVMGRDEE